jgi:acyl dehydratase
MGLMEIQCVRFRRPVKTGDTVTARLLVKSIMPRGEKPGMLLQTEDTVTNQRDETVMTFRRLILVRAPADATQ